MQAALRSVTSSVLSASFVLAALAAQEPAAPIPRIEVELWPEGAPGALGSEPQDRPRVFVHPLAGDEARPAIVVCPGGGYGSLAILHEGTQVGAWLNGIGVVAVVLDYRHRGKGYGHPAPLLDVQRALRLVRHHAAAWHVDPELVGVLGFSAGGHLASSVSVHHDGGDPAAQDPVDRRSCRPDFAVLCYPVIAFDQPFTHRGSQHNLLGSDAPPELVAQMSSERHVANDTPPTFLWHTSDDAAVPVQNSLVYYQALVAHSVPCELHVFESGRHGLGLARGEPARAWVGLCERWLARRFEVGR